MLQGEASGVWAGKRSRLSSRSFDQQHPSQCRVLLQAVLTTECCPGPSDHRVPPQQEQELLQTFADQQPVHRLWGGLYSLAEPVRWRGTVGGRAAP